MSNVFDSKILVVGSGGLGCELLKCLVLSGFRKISIVDFDKVSFSNLNRQFLFSSASLHRFKSEVAFESIKAWNDPLYSNFYNCRVEDLSLEVLSGFDIIFSSLDSIESRRWLNAALFEISRDSSHRLLIDGGSQNLYGHARAIRPGLTSCIECSLSLFSPDDPPPCTLAGNLKSPEDCINYVLYLDSEHSYSLADQIGPLGFLEHVYQSALKVSRDSGIEGVTMDLVDQICNRSVPNISTTNAVISSLMVNMAINPDSIKDRNFYFYTGDGLTSLSGFNLNPDENCLICQSKSLDLHVSTDLTLKDLISLLCERLDSTSVNISSSKAVIYLGTPKILSDSYKSRLNMRLSDLRDLLTDRIYVTNPQSPFSWVILLNLNSL